MEVGGRGSKMGRDGGGWEGEGEMQVDKRMGGMQVSGRGRGRDEGGWEGEQEGRDVGRWEGAIV